MTSSTFSGLGGRANHSLRDVGKAELRAEVDRPIASQGINVDMRSLFELPVMQNPHNTRGGSSWRGPQMRVGLLTTAIFGDLSGYFFGNFGDKASNITWQYATPCWPVTDCKINDLEWLFHVKLSFRTSTFRFRGFDFEA